MKIASLNVKILQYYEERLNKIVKLILDNEIDIICFQEITRQAIERIARDTNMKYVFRFGNAVMTKLPFLESKFIGLFSYRGAIKVKIQYEDIVLNIIATHLDHLNEDTRMKQLEKLKPQLENADFLIGDMNALYQYDYSKKKRKKINENRLNAKLEKYRHEVVDLILNNGFKINDFIEPTCPYGTRVDYIFVNDNLNKKRKFKQNHEVIDTIQDDITDHNMLILELTT